MQEFRSSLSHSQSSIHSSFFDDIKYNIITIITQQHTMDRITCQVQAPIDLPGGYVFDATVDGITVSQSFV